MSTLPNELVTDHWPIWSNCNPGVMICGASWRILLHIFSIFFCCSILRQRCWPGVVHQVNILLPHLSNSSTRDNISPFPTFFSSKTWTLSWVHTKNTLKHIIYMYMRKSKWCGGGLGPVSDPGLLSCYCHIHHYHHRHPFLLPSHYHPCLSSSSF